MLKLVSTSTWCSRSAASRSERYDSALVLHRGDLRCGELRARRDPARQAARGLPRASSCMVAARSCRSSGRLSSASSRGAALDLVGRAPL